jgi:hypothetical protein
MRRLIMALASLAATRLAVAIVRRVSRSKTVEHKVEALQDKFRSLDKIPTPD